MTFIKKKLQNLKITNKNREELIGYSFVGVWIFGFLLLTIIPLFQTLMYSFQEVLIKVDGISTTFIGLENYRKMFTTELTFMDNIRVFVGEILLYVPIIITFSLIVAVILNQKIKARGLFRAIYFLPVIIISGPIVSELFSQGVTTIPMIEEYGIIEIINSSFPNWLAEPLSIMFQRMIYILWMSGVQILIFLSGLQKIDQTTYEAAKVDGAGPWLCFWKITLPAISSLIGVNILYSVVTLSTFANNEVLRKIRRDMMQASTGYGYASAEAIVYFIVIVMLLLFFALVFAYFSRKQRRG